MLATDSTMEIGNGSTVLCFVDRVTKDIIAIVGIIATFHQRVAMIALKLSYFRNH